jgi:uncharacterized membrane protein YoaK (UPF0700 family)
MLENFNRWVWFGAAVLAAIGGMVNAIGYMSYAHQAVTHMTGTTTQFALAVGDGRQTDALHLIFILLTFMLGASVSGLILGSDILRLGRRYGVVLMIESILLGIAARLMTTHSAYGIYFASTACGLQNAMASTYSGTLLRTTHLTGMFTDIGIAFGHLIRGTPISWIRLRLCFLIIGFFWIGGVLGHYTFLLFEYQALFVPAIFTAVTGFLYASYRHRQLMRSTT